MLWPCLNPRAGTDVLGMKTLAIPSDKGFIVNGRKMWITNGTIDEHKTPADCVLLYALSQDRQIITFAVEKDFAGYEVGAKNQR